VALVILELQSPARRLAGFRRLIWSGTDRALVWAKLRLVQARAGHYNQVAAGSAAGLDCSDS
jgi:hypothetical protein